MSRDQINERFENKKDKKRLSDLEMKNLPKDEAAAIQEMIDKTEKVKPIQSDKAPGRNDPCPCGSGKKYKKCCGENK